MGKRKGFWGKFDDLMDSLPGYIDSEIKYAKKDIVSSRKSTTITLPKMVHTTSSSEIWQNGKHVIIKTVNGKTTIKVNGKEYVPKEK